jgi:hypothetical protein
MTITMPSTTTTSRVNLIFPEFSSLHIPEVTLPNGGGVFGPIVGLERRGPEALIYVGTRHSDTSRMTLRIPEGPLAETALTTLRIGMEKSWIAQVNPAPAVLVGDAQLGTVTLTARHLMDESEIEKPFPWGTSMSLLARVIRRQKLRSFTILDLHYLVADDLRPGDHRWVAGQAMMGNEHSSPDLRDLDRGDVAYLDASVRTLPPATDRFDSVLQLWDCVPLEPSVLDGVPLP